MALGPPLNRRDFLKGALAGMALAATARPLARVLAAALGGEGPRPHGPGPYDPAAMVDTTGEVDHRRNGFDPSQILTDFDWGRASPLPGGRTLREYDLVAVDKTIEVAPGISYPAWTYNGRIPGPTLRCREGDRIRVRFRNAGAHPHSVHFHGIHSGAVDGVPGAGVVPRGGEFLYEFDAEPAGVHLYHCHAFPLSKHFAKGLYGVYIVDPREGWPPAAHELVMVLNGIDVDFDDENDFYAVNTIPFHYQKHPIRIRTGEKVRIFLVNALEFDPVNSFHLHANFFHYYPTGTQAAPRDYTDTIVQGQAERGIVEFTYARPGRYMFHAHKTEFAELGWTGFFDVEG